MLKLCSCCLSEIVSRTLTMKLSLFSKVHIEQLLSEITVLQSDLIASQIQSRSVYEYGVRQAGRLGEHFAPLFKGNAARVETLLDSLPLVFAGDWNDECWKSWKADEPRETELLRI